MIVICPSCGTTYRHATGVPPEGSRARCSRCEDVFPLTDHRSYRVTAWAGVAGEPPGAPLARAVRAPVVLAGSASAVPARGPVAAGRDLSFGMDDPALAADLRRTALNAEAGADRRPVTWWVAPSEEPSATPPRDRDGTPMAAAEPRLRAAPDRPAPRPHTRSAAPALGALWGGLAGLALWDFAGVAPWISGPGGGLAGLVVGLGWCRWNARSR